MKLSIITIVALICILATLSFADSLTVQPTTQPVVTDTVSQQQAASTDTKLEYPLSPERQAKLQSYAQFVNIWRFVDFFVSIAVLALLLFTGLSAKFRNWAKSAKRKFLVSWLYLAILLVVMYILQFPFTYYREFVVESQYGFMHQSFGEWMFDGLKSLAIGIVIGIIPMWFFYFLIDRIKKWWLAFSIGMLPFLIFFVVIAPVVITPMFNKFEPLKDKQLESQILAEAGQAGISGSRVFEVDASKQSSKINAYCTGLFGTTRIVLFDTLIKGFSYDEIRFVMGHEMGHYVKGHIWWGLLMAVLFVFVMLWLTDKTIHSIIARYRTRFKFERLGDIASLPLVLMFVTVMSFVFQPATNGMSRYFEHQSDIYGMNISGVSGETAATAFAKLSAYNLSDPNPNGLIEFWFYDHPALNKRMEFVRSYKPGN